jgi:hypothetical protein
MSCCLKNYDVKLLRHGGCVPATHDVVEELNCAIYCDAHFVPLLINSKEYQR